MRFPPDLVSSSLIRRLNRFAVEVNLNGLAIQAHLPNSGRLHELLIPGTPALLVPRSGPLRPGGRPYGRKTSFDLLMVRLGDQWVSADARLPNPLFREALEANQLAAFRGYNTLRSEATFADSRIDFYLEGPEGSCLAEIKSVTLVVDGLGLFPDAPTERGARHLRALMEARRQGHQAAVVFIIQRADAHSFSPHDAADPAFGLTLRQAADFGVSVLAYRCAVSPTEMWIMDEVPVRL